MADGSLIFDTKLDTNGLSTGLGKIGSVAGTAFKGVAVAVGGASTAIGALTKSALDGYASYEQLSGGVETLFKDSSGQVMQYAENAYQTAGLSANQYMETVTSFSASLIQSVGGDTAKAAEIADMAIIDMSDNANKMGTSIDMIQNAYNGFAKGNFTMLDNLKLGYGGTKEEMERLLADAEKISGIEYDISSFADITEAIHVMQTEMGIAGTTATEASSTIEGSLSSMKASWQNLVVGIANENANLDELINQFVESAATAGENILPRIETILSGIGQLIETMLPVIMAMLPGIINDVLPQLTSAGVAMINSIITGITENLDSLLELATTLITQLVGVIVENLPALVDAGTQIVLMLVDTIVANLPTLIEAGLQVIVQLALGIAEALPELVPAVVDAVLLIVDTLITNVSMLVDAAIEIIVALAEGLIGALPQLIERVPEILDALLTAIVENAPKLLEAGLQLIVTLAGALITYLPQLLAKVPEMISSLVTSFVNLVVRFNEVGLMIDSTIRDAIASGWSTITNAVSGWVNTLKDKFTSAISNFKSIGSDIVSGIWNGIKDGWNWLVDQVSSLANSLLNAAKDALGIQSPSKKFRYLGEMCVAGFDEGVEDLMDGSAIARSINASVRTIGDNTSANRTVGGFNQTINVNKEIGTPDELARTIRLESKYGLMKGVAFA